MDPKQIAEVNEHAVDLNEMSAEVRDSSAARKLAGIAQELFEMVRRAKEGRAQQ